MSKDILQITISERKSPKTKFGKWFYNKIWFPLWSIWRPRMLAKFYKGMSDFMLMFLPKQKREEFLKEFEDVEVQIVNETLNSEMTQVVKDALREQFGEEFDEEKFEAILRKECENNLK